MSNVLTTLTIVDNLMIVKFSFINTDYTQIYISMIRNFSRDHIFNKNLS